jgi:hypothetical protein
MQIPHFLERGVDLRSFHPATLNVSVAPRAIRLARPDITLREVRWHLTEPAEDFSFAGCRLHAGGEVVDALVYRPHPETKPEHFQSPDTIELMAPWVDGLTYGDRVVVEAPDGVLVLQ